MSRTGARVVVMPDPQWDARESVIRRLEDRIGVDGVVRLEAPLDATRVCAALLATALETPLVIVAHATACRVLPAVALSLRTRHLATCGYVLIDPDAPASSDTWPESPVFIVGTVDADYARGLSLRGWPVVSGEQDTAGAVAAVVAELLGEIPSA